VKNTSGTNKKEKKELLDKLSSGVEFKTMFEFPP
jgi:hypothetical protein